MRNRYVVGKLEMKQASGLFSCKGQRDSKPHSHVSSHIGKVAGRPHPRDNWTFAEIASATEAQTKIQRR